MKIITAQERQNRIYRKMTPKKKAEITFEFCRIGQYLDGQKNAKVSRVKKSNPSRKGS